MQLNIDSYLFRPKGIALRGGRMLSDWDFRTDKQYFTIDVMSEIAVSTPTLNLFELGTESNANYLTYISVNGRQSYDELFYNVNNNGFLIDHIRMIVPFQRWLEPALQITYNNANGREFIYPVFPLTNLDADQHEPLMVDIDLKEEPILLDGNTVISYRFPQTIDLRFLRLICSYKKRIMKSSDLKVYEKLIQL